ncbi:MAG: SseB family protein [Pseudomonadota bacterium]
MSETRLDAAVAEFAQSDQARLAFFERFAESELFLLLDKEPDGDAVDPTVFDVEGGALLAVFDRVERLTSFTGQPSPYAAVSGRVLSEMIAGQALGLALNLGVEGREMVVDETMLTWLRDMLKDAPEEVSARITEVSTPVSVPENLVSALDAKLAQAGGLAVAAVLVAVRYDTGGQGHLLAVLDAMPGAEAAFGQAVSEALKFSGLDAAMLDIGYFASNAPEVAAFMAHGLRFDLPQLAMPEPPKSPGMDPEKPPKLR